MEAAGLYQYACATPALAAQPQESVNDGSLDADAQGGIALPLGTHELEGGVNFALFGRDASRVRLELWSLSSGQ